MADVAELIVSISADDSGLQAAVGKSEKAFQTFANAAKSGTAALQSSIQESIAAARENGTLTQTLKDLQKAALAVPQGTAEWHMIVQEAGSLKDEIMDTRAQVDFFADDFGKIKGLIGIGEAAAAGFSIAQGAAGLFGASAEKVQQALLKVQSAQAILNGLQSISKTLNKDSASMIMLNAAAQKAYTLAVGASSGALKIFRLALIGTGIGAIIVAIGLLIANFDTVKDAILNGSAAFDKVKKVLMVVAPAIYIVIEAIQYLRRNWDKVLDILAEVGLADDRQTRDAKANAEERVNAIEGEREKIGNKYDFEIAKAQAAGKSTHKLEQEKRAAILETLKVEALALIERDKLNGTFTEDTKKRLSEINKEIIKLGQERVVSEISHNKKTSEDWKTTQEEKRKKAKEVNDLMISDMSEMAEKMSMLGKEGASEFHKAMTAPAVMDFSGMMEEELIDEPELDALLERVKTKMNDVQTFQQQLAQQTSQLIQTNVADAVTGFAEMLGNVAATGGEAMQGFGKKFLGVILNFLSGFGKLLIAAGTAKIALEKLALSGVGAVVAGAALIATTAAVKAHLNKGVPALAEGGLAFGPTLAMVGDNRGASANPEVIAPLDKLQSMMGGEGGTGGQVEFVIAGDNLRGVLKRNDNYRNRVS